RTLFSLEETVTLFDLTNTCERGLKSAELWGLARNALRIIRRAFCTQILVLGLVWSGRDFV
ncbi:MAG: transposase, partial [Betaproteobacteria bacterium]